jgi:hypothetical protein
VKQLGKLVLGSGIIYLSALDVGSDEDTVLAAESLINCCKKKLDLSEV